MPNPFAEILEKKNTNIIDTLTDITFETEGLISGQTPLRISNKEMRSWNTVQGIPIDKNAQIPSERSNFFFVAPNQVGEVIKRQWRNYFKDPEKYGMSKDATIEDAVKTFDKTNPQNKLNQLKQRGIDIKKKLKEFNFSSLNPFSIQEAEAAAESLDLKKNPFTEIVGSSSQSVSTPSSEENPFEEILQFQSQPVFGYTGNIDLNNRPIIHNSDGTISSEKSFSFEENGKEILIPSIVNGKELSKQDAIAYYHKTGENLGIFKTSEEADVMAARIHGRYIKPISQDNLIFQNIAKISLMPFEISKEMIPFAVSKFFEAGQRTSQAIGTMVNEAISNPFYKQVTPTGYAINEQHLGEAFLAGFAPELYPSYPKDKITTVGKMVRDIGEKVFDLYGTPEEAEKFAKSPEWQKNLAILGTTAGRTAFDFISIFPDVYTNPATYLTLKLVSAGLKLTPLTKIDIAKKLTTEYKMPETVNVPAQTIRDSLNQGLTSAEMTDLLKIVGPEAWKKALKEGSVNIKIPAREIVTIVDRPWWGKVKQFFGGRVAEPKISISYAGQPIPAPSGALPLPSGKVATLVSPEEVIAEVKLRKAPVFDLPRAVERGDYRTMIKASNIKFPEELAKNFQPEELKKIRMLFTGGVEISKAVQELNNLYPSLNIESDADLMRKAIDQTGKALKKAESEMKDKDWEKELQAFKEKELEYEAEGIQSPEIKAIEDDIVGKEPIENLEEYKKLETQYNNHKELLDRGFDEKYIERMSDEIRQEIVDKKLTPDEVSILPSGELRVVKTELPDIEAMNTDELEKYIDSRYEADAPQAELNKLEDIYAKRVVEHELNMTEEEIGISEGIGLEEQLVKMYHRYLNRDPKTGLSIEGMMSIEDIVDNMRSVLKDYAPGGILILKETSDEQILAAAKDIYEHKQKLIEKYKIGQKITEMEISTNEAVFTEEERNLIKNFAPDNYRENIIKAYKQIVEGIPREKILAQFQTISSPQEIVERGQGTGYLTQQDNLDAMVKQYGDFSLVVKDVNGNRARLNASDFLKLSQYKVFTDRIKEVWINPEHKPLDKPSFQEGFMETLNPQKLLEEPKTSPRKEELLSVEGIKLTNKSTITPIQVQKFKEALSDNNIRSLLKENNIKEIRIDAPYKFSLSEQANIGESIISINADAINPTSTILHELGHQKFESLSKDIQDQLLKKVKTWQNPLIKGYISLKEYKEAVAELLYKDKSFYTEPNPFSSILPQPTMPPTPLQPEKPQQELPALTELKYGLSPQVQKTIFDNAQDAQAKLSEKEKAARVLIPGVSSDIIKDPKLRAVLYAGRKKMAYLDSGLVNWLKDAATGLFETIKLEYEPTLKNFPQLQDDIRTGPVTFSRKSREQAELALGGLIGNLNSYQEDLFFNILGMKDLIARGGEGIILPQNLKVENIQTELDNLLKTTPQPILDAVTKYDQLMKDVGLDLVAREKLGLDELKTNYFPHYVLDYMPIWWDESAAYLPKRLRKPYGAYLKKAVGSTKDIAISKEALIWHLSSVFMDNAIDDWAIEQLIKYDKFGLIPEQIEKLGPIKPNDIKIIEVKGEGKKYRGFQYQPGRQVYPAQMTNPSVLNKAVEEDLSTQEWLISIGKKGGAPVTQGLALGRYNRIYLLPIEIYDRFIKLKVPFGDNPFLQLAMPATTQWKRITLDWAGIPFQAANFFGDFINLYRTAPGAAKEVKTALDILRHVREPAKLSPWQQHVLEMAHEKDVLGAGFVQEYAHISPFMTPKGILEKLERLSSLREGVLRLAMFSYQLQRAEVGLPLIGPEFSDYIQKIDKESAAAYIARNFTVDYLAIPDYYRRWIRGFAAPFITFYHVNAKNWAKYVKNAPFGFVLKILAPIAGLWLYNNTGERKKVEERLPEYWRWRPIRVNIKSYDLDKDGILDRALIWAPQTPIEMAEAMVGMDRVMDKITLIRANKMTIEEAAKQQLIDSGLGAVRSVHLLLNPMIQFFEGVLSNRDPRTHQEVVPSELDKISETTKLPYRTRYFFEKMLAPVGQYLKESKGIEPTSWGIFSGPLDLPRAFGFYTVNLTGADAHIEMDKNRKMRGDYDTYMYKIERRYIENRDYSDIEKEAWNQGINLTAKNIYDRLYSTRVQIEKVKEELRQTRELLKRRRLEIELDDLIEQRAVETLKQVPKGARK